ncbi:UNVERIFIED_CONTAM: hypothetical protein FKN15_002283 [Acipenser sinensis]
MLSSEACAVSRPLFSHCGLTMQPPKSYGIGGQRSSRAAYRQARRHPARLQGLLPAEGAVPRGLLISNDNTAPRENTRSASSFLFLGSGPRISGNANAAAGLNNALSDDRQASPLGVVQASPGNGELASAGDGEQVSPGDAEQQATPGNAEQQATPGDAAQQATPSNAEQQATPGDAKQQATPGDIGQASLGGAWQASLRGAGQASLGGAGQASLGGAGQASLGGADGDDRMGVSGQGGSRQNSSAVSAGGCGGSSISSPPRGGNHGNGTISPSFGTQSHCSTFFHSR